MLLNLLFFCLSHWRNHILSKVVIKCQVKSDALVLFFWKYFHSLAGFLPSSTDGLFDHSILRGSFRQPNLPMHCISTVSIWRSLHKAAFSRTTIWNAVSATFFYLGFEENFRQNMSFFQWLRQKVANAATFFT